METVYKDSMCRCCASEGSFKDFTASYEWMGVEEVYADMLKDCFDITLSSPVPGNSNGGICEVCVTQLRNAFNFKKQVQNTEERFKKMQEVVFKPETIKIEIPNDDMDINSDNLDDDFSGPDYEVPIKFESSEEKPKKRTRASTSAARAKRAKTDGETSSKRILQSTGTRSSGNSKRKIIAETIKIVWKNSFTEEVPELKDKEIKKHRHNIRQMLECTNATPIRCHGGRGYACCFCEDQYEDPKDLKKHTLDQHSSNTKDFMKTAIMSKYIVKLDITGLKCNLCEESPPNIDQLTTHLIKAHDIKFFTDIKSHVVPFKFETESLTCAICPQIFNRFKGLLEHMSIHFRNYTCDICDAGFVNRSTLKNHVNCHENGSYQCEVCSKTFASYRKMKMHEKSVHVYSNRINRCGYCKELFKSHRKKEKHLVEVHGVKTATINCQACDKTFETQSQLRVHTKRDHLCERRFVCNHCDMRFFLNHELQDHLVKHTGVRTFECVVCHKAYGRRKTLREHMRIHDDDRRFKCEHCSQAFVQKCSWRSHMRTKHGEDV